MPGWRKRRLGGRGIDLTLTLSNITLQVDLLEGELVENILLLLLHDHLLVNLDLFEGLFRLFRVIFPELSSFIISLKIGNSKDEGDFCIA